MLTVRWREDLNGLQRLEYFVPRRADDWTKAAAERCRDIIRASWSDKSPSAPGNPPAVVSGELDRSIVVRKVNVGFIGSKKAHATTAGAAYARMLEEGTIKMAARPFVRPAAERTLAELPPDPRKIFSIR